jgi:hypothetical protein
MSRFILLHSSVPQVTQEELFKCGKEVRGSLPPGVEWLNSWWIPETGTLICEWEAPDAEIVKAALGPALDIFPIETIHEVQWVDPDWYMQ